jgi:hypothetical protein
MCSSIHTVPSSRCRASSHAGVASKGRTPRQNKRLCVLIRYCGSCLPTLMERADAVVADAKSQRMMPPIASGLAHASSQPRLDNRIWITLSKRSHRPTIHHPVGIEAMKARAGPIPHTVKKSDRTRRTINANALRARASQRLRAVDRCDYRFSLAFAGLQAKHCLIRARAPSLVQRVGMASFAKGTTRGWSQTFYGV